MTTKVLGKGLSALMGEGDTFDAKSFMALEGERNVLPIDLIIPGQYQPRQHFDEAAIHELAESIKQHGIISPITVRPISNGRYEIIAGERRWRASRIAGLVKIPAIIKTLTNTQALEIALVENMQRQDLTPLEEADGLQHLIEQFSYTHETLAAVIGKSRSHISNLLRLLTLPHAVKEMINHGLLSMGHARALVNADDALAIAERIVKEGLSVRKAEQLVSKKPQNPRPKTKQTPDSALQSELSNLEEALSRNLGMMVKIEDDGGVGRVSIYFHNLEQLDQLLGKLQ